MAFVVPCFHPIDAWQLSDGSIVFCERGDTVRSLSLPCGRCRGCRLERSRQWATRCLHESKLHRDNCFVTLTYNDEHLPADGSLNHKHFQDFFKRLRKRLSYVDPTNGRRVFPTVRFYMAGEYGTDLGRPHYHALIFGFIPNDLIPCGSGETGCVVYSSRFLDSVWGNGLTFTGEFTFESAAYVARYVMDKVTGSLADEHYRRVNVDSGEIYYLVPEYNKMSLKPGIGSGWYDKFKSEVRDHDRVIINGKKAKPPRYYLTKLDKEDPFKFEVLKYKRFLESQKVDPFECSPERLAVRELCTNERLKFYKRNLF